MDLTRLYTDGGFFMAPILACGIGSAVAGLVALLVHRKSAGIVAIGFSVLCFALGYAAYYAGMIAAVKTLQSTRPHDIGAAMVAAEQQFHIPLYFGSLCSIPGLIGGIVALVAVRRRRDRMASSQPPSRR